MQINTQWGEVEELRDQTVRLTNVPPPQNYQVDKNVDGGCIPELACVVRKPPQEYSPAPAMVAAFDPLAPSQASSSTSPDNTTFHTLTRERQFRHPPLNASDVPALDELVAPHIKSFNALIEDEGNPGAKGLLQMGVEDIGEKVVFDGKGSEGGLGTKLSCMSGDCIAQSLANAHLIRPNRPSRS